MFQSPNTTPRVTLAILIERGFFKEDTLVHFRNHFAKVASNGLLYPNSHDNYKVPSWLLPEYETPSAWATAVARNGNPNAKNACNGWTCVKLVETNEMIDVYRQRFLESDNMMENKENENVSVLSGGSSHTSAKETIIRIRDPTKSKTPRVKTMSLSGGERGDPGVTVATHDAMHSASFILTPVGHAVPIPHHGYNQVIPFCFSCSSPSVEANFETSECNPSSWSDMVSCVHCGEWYHNFCITAGGSDKKSTTSASHWQCMNCLVCKVCFESEPEHELLVCDQCETGTHLSCLQGDLASVPEGRWLCDECVKCKECGARTPSGSRPTTKPSSAQWMFDYSMCEPCGQLKEKGNFCPVCQHVYYDDDYETPMIECEMATCQKWVHVACDPDLTDARYQSLSNNSSDEKYHCPGCRGQPLPASASETTSSSLSTSQSTSPIQGEHPQPAKETKRSLADDDDEFEDARRCLLCLKYGNQGPKGEGRLLFLASWNTLLGHCDSDGQLDVYGEDWGWWVHANCLYYNDDYDLSMDGSLLKKMRVVVKAASQVCVSELFGCVD
jgi:hypothetical protein